MLQNRNRNRIARGSKVRDSDNFDSCDHFAGWKRPRCVGLEQTVERYNSHNVTIDQLRRSKFVHDTFESTYRRMKLPDHVHDTHYNLPSFTNPKEGELPNPLVVTHEVLYARPTP
jgi:hypothetical protein